MFNLDILPMGILFLTLLFYRFMILNKKIHDKFRSLIQNILSRDAFIFLNKIRVFLIFVFGILDLFGYVGFPLSLDVSGFLIFHEGFGIQKLLGLDFCFYAGAFYRFGLRLAIFGYRVSLNRVLMGA